MAKPVKLETTKVDLTVFADKSKDVAKGRHKFDSAMVTMYKADLARLVSDFEVLLKALKKAGIKVERPLHYNETKEYKQSIASDRRASNSKPKSKKRVRL